MGRGRAGGDTLADLCFGFILVVFFCFFVIFGRSHGGSFGVFFWTLGGVLNRGFAPCILQKWTFLGAYLATPKM